MTIPPNPYLANPEKILAIRTPTTKPVTPPKQVTGFVLVDKDGYYLSGYYNHKTADCSYAWYAYELYEATKFATKTEAKEVRRLLARSDGLDDKWRIVRIVKSATYEDGYFAGILQGKKNLAADINGLMEKHHTGTNADTLNAIEAFLQDYLK